MICQTFPQDRRYIAQKVVPIANISNTPSKSYHPRENRFHKELEKYLEDPFEKIPILYHTHPVKKDMPKTFLKWFDQNMRQEPSDPDFEPFPIWSKKLN